MDTVAKYEATQFLNTLRAADRNVSDLDSTSSSNSLNTKFLKRLPADYNPQFAYVVVKKRISTRILLKKGPNYENPPPGTVLDHTVTNFNFKDFFLVPQGTMRKLKKKIWVLGQKAKNDRNFSYMTQNCLEIKRIYYLF